MGQFELVRERFEFIGSRFKVARMQQPRVGNRITGYRLTVGRDRKGEFFRLWLTDSPLELFVASFRRQNRHLLLAARCEGITDKYLCGFDERHWFIAGVDPKVSNVEAAKESLKPDEVLDEQARRGLRRKDRHRRKNAAFRRQGEWFFIPAPDIDPDPVEILHNERIFRGFGRAHIVEEIFRTGGYAVYVSSEHPQGVSETTYRRIILKNPKKANLRWQTMQRDMITYARGRVRHPDHRTVLLNGWHRVMMNNEISNTGIAVKYIFLD